MRNKKPRTDTTDVIEIDEDLHLGHLAVCGHDTMRRLFYSNVLVSGLQGLGAEIAKNLILAGVKSVTLHDEKAVELWDLSSNFVFTEDDIGNNRAIVSAHKLQSLNHAVVVSVLTAPLVKELLSNYQAVVFTDTSIEKSIEFNDFCHNQNPPIPFLKTEVRGLFGSVFCDFGPHFTVVDVDGEDPHTGIIASINNDNPAIVACVDDEKLLFQDGDSVVFSDVLGMSELNDGKPRKVKDASPYFFTIEEDTTNYGTYQRGGIATQVKQPKVLDFRTLREALKDPGDFLLLDSSMMHRPPLLHLAFQALDRFTQELGRFPVAGSDDDAQKFISLVADVNNRSMDGKLEYINPGLLRHFAFGARAVLNPMATLFGGIVGQEVVKACSGKFHPIFQFFYFDSMESLPTEPIDPSDMKLLNSRYDAQISVFGSKLQKRLESAKAFVVGSNAQGCEFLKNLALMGVCCGKEGKLTLTDDDAIRKSDLSSHFLFRDWNIGQDKSTVAASAASLINPHLNIEALKNCGTENVFDDNFWENLNVVISAARLCMDKKCLDFQKPLLESRTLGAKCHTEMVIPRLTESYQALGDPPGNKAPFCTVDSYPYKIEHCLTWAREKFKALLEKTPTKVNAYLSKSPHEYFSTMINAQDIRAELTWKCTLECLEKEWCGTFQDCITWARLRFEDFFVNDVKLLMFCLPEDATTNDGALYWSAPKRFPHPIEFSVDDPAHLQFITAASILRAETFGIPTPDWVKSSAQRELVDAINNVIVPEFDLDKAVLGEDYPTNARERKKLLMKLENCRGQVSPGFKMNPIRFDEDTNYHMDFIVGLANMRARNYAIPQVDKLKAKLISGCIIPTIATSTAAATGLVCLELYKVLGEGHGREDYRNTSVDLALPMFSISAPVPPKAIKHLDMCWTIWDKWILGQDDPTVGDLIQWLLESKDLKAHAVFFGESVLYRESKKKHGVGHVDSKLASLVRDVARADQLPPYRLRFDLAVACRDADDNFIHIPPISIYFM